MKIIFIIFFAVSFICNAEPAKINKSALISFLNTNTMNPDGNWLKNNCERYVEWHKQPGTLWQDKDSNEENLGAGLCAGFILGIISKTDIEICQNQDTTLEERVLNYIRQNPTSIHDPAEKIVLDAISLMSECQ